MLINLKPIEFILMSSRVGRYLFLLLQLICISTYSQVVTSVRHYTTSDGLSDNRVTAIIKDKEGFMWFGSWAGITRFDGKTFITFKSYPGDRSSLKSNRIDDVVEDPGGRYLWLKAYDKQVYRFDKQTQTFASLPDLLKDVSIAQLSFSKILNVKNNCVWLRTEGRGIVQIANSGGVKPVATVFSKEASPGLRIPSNELNFFYLDKFNDVWLGTSAGLCILKKQKEYQYKVKLPFESLRGEVFTRITDGAGKTL
jgi:ligand-binding sensor domain-containing protein